MRYYRIYTACQKYFTGNIRILNYKQIGTAKSLEKFFRVTPVHSIRRSVYILYNMYIMFLFYVIKRSYQRNKHKIPKR